MESVVYTAASSPQCSSAPFLLLVGLLRHPHSIHDQQHQHVCASNQFLGRRYLSPDLLAHIIPLRRGEAAPDDRPDGRRPQRWTKTVPQLEGSCTGCVEGAWVERVLAGICAVFPEGVPGECYGFGCIRRRDAYLAMKKSGYIRTAYIFNQ